MAKTQNNKFCFYIAPKKINKTSPKGKQAKFIAFDFEQISRRYFLAEAKQSFPTCCCFEAFTVAVALSCFVTFHFVVARLFAILMLWYRAGIRTVSPLALMPWMKNISIFLSFSYTKLVFTWITWSSLSHTTGDQAERINSEMKSIAITNNYWLSFRPRSQAVHNCFIKLL